MTLGRIWLAAGDDDSLRASTLVDEVAFRIQKAIMDGELRPGQSLIQEELCARFGVSRTPVREALRLLEAQGLVVLQANRTAFVRRLGRREIEELYAVRANLEGLACELAVKHASAEALAELERAQARLEAAAERLRTMQTTKDESEQAQFHDELRVSNDRFHSHIHVLSQSNLLRALIGLLWNAFPKDYVWRALTREEDMLALNVTQHRDVMVALAARKGVAARRAMVTHVTFSGRLLVDYLEEHAYLPPSE